ncbi:MAG: diguanylate cyclase [Candidatus Eremiobacteraeota bacterium]|nr:diguanylate cyclase [Candidatus Eremiobacteraeota bacterium]MCW5872406.1 diguanylate cyclase [Candidatus Eremiobacteraeota bacterium]
MAIPRLNRAEPAVDRVPFLKILEGHQAGLILVLEGEELTLGRDPACDIVIDEIGVSRFHCSVRRSGNGWEVADLNSTNGTYVNDKRIARSDLIEEDTLILGPECSLRFDRQPAEEVELARRLFEGARLDGLTRVFNRVTFFERLAQEISYSQRQHSTFGLLLFDIDHFKKINDSYGHPGGDAVLRQVAARARAMLRLEDTLGRYGGEEFAILLRNSGLSACLRVAERLRAEIADRPFEMEGQEPVTVTASIGVATWRAEVTQDGLVAQADEQLYAAKQAGRNRVMPRSE